jgi:hypothetical protein
MNLIGGQDYPFIRFISHPVKSTQLQPLDPRCRVVQFCEPLTVDEYAMVAELMDKHPGVALRLFCGGHEWKDIDVLRYFTSVCNIVIDLHFIKNMDGLNYLSKDLKSLGLGSTKSKSFSLGVLRRFPNLKELYLEGHSRDIEVVSELLFLERLEIRSIAIPGLDILLPLVNLWWLAIKLGGTKDIRALPSIEKLKYLEIWRVTGFNDLGPLEDIRSIQYLFLQTLSGIRDIPSLRKLHVLRRIHLEEMKNLRDISSLAQARALEELLIMNTSSCLKPSDFKALSRLPSLKRANVYIGSRKKNEAVKTILQRPAFPYDKADFHFL